MAPELPPPPQLSATAQQTIELNQSLHDTKTRILQEESAAKLVREQALLNAQIAALQNPVAVAPVAVATVPEDDHESKLTEEAQLIMPQFIGLKRSLVIDVFVMKLRPENLCKLVFSADLDEENRDYGVEMDASGTLKGVKNHGKMKDFGSNPVVWSERFLNYLSIEQAFHGKNHPTLNRAHIVFHAEVLKCCKIFDWVKGVLPMVMAFQKERIYTNTIHDAASWLLTERFILLYCRPHPRIIPSNSRTPIGRGGPHPQNNQNNRFADNNRFAEEPNDNSVVCKSYNKYANGCNWAQCRRRHECEICGGKHTKKDHK